MFVAVDDDTLGGILQHYLRAWGMQSHAVRSEQDLLTAVGDIGESAGNWIGLVDPDGERCEELAVLLCEGAGIDPAKIIRVGAHPTLEKPVRQSALFDCIVNVVHPSAGASNAVEFAARAAPSAEQLRAGPVLVAEDNAAMHEVLVQQFGELGVNVKVVSDGAQAVAAVEREEFALVFMDCQMPGVDGLAATRLIRDAERAGGKHVPIVAMTANAFKEDRAACIAAGMDDYLAKPVRLKDLREMLGRWLPRGTVTP